MQTMYSPQSYGWESYDNISSQISRWSNISLSTYPLHSSLYVHPYGNPFVRQIGGEGFECPHCDPKEPQNKCCPLLKRAQMVLSNHFSSLWFALFPPFVESKVLYTLTLVSCLADWLLLLLPKSIWRISTTATDSSARLSAQWADRTVVGRQRRRDDDVMDGYLKINIIYQVTPNKSTDCGSPSSSSPVELKRIDCLPPFCQLI